MHTTNKPLLITALLLVSILCRTTFAEEKAEKPLRIICFGAHPDDAEYKSGGTAALWAKMGHKVKLVSVTNGDIGHFAMAGGTLAKRRTAEAAACAKILGVESKVMDIHDGELMPTLENRKKIVRLIREWKADIVISHRPWDYHPDHRYVGILVQDAAFMVTVKYFCPDTPHLKKNPVFLYSSDRFQKPYPFRPDIVVAVDNVFDQKVKAIAELVSQSIEGGVGGSWGTSGSLEKLAKLPSESDKAGRIAIVKKKWHYRQGSEAKKFRDDLIQIYGKEVGSKIKYAEAFERCEYGARATQKQLMKLFPIEASIPK